MDFRVIDGSPCPAEVAAQVFMVLRKAGQTATSIYRGEDAQAILHAHGKHTQAEIHQMFPAISNPPGLSEHECRSDGVGKAGPNGRVLPPWQVGVDSGSDSDADKAAIEASARSFGWVVHHHYQRGVEGHHWCFDAPPRPRDVRQRVQIAALRLRLPRK